MKLSLYTSWQEKCGISDYSCLLKAALERIGISVEVVPVVREKGIAPLQRSVEQMNDADIAHIQFEYTFFAERSILRSLAKCSLFLGKIRIPKVITMHEIAPLWKPRTPFRVNRHEIMHLLRGFLRPFSLMLYRKMFSYADIVVIHTEKQRTVLREMDIDEKKIRLLPLPVPDADPLSRTRDEYKRSLGCEGKLVLTIFGFINRRKGYELAFEAVRTIDGCVLLVAGGQHPIDTSDYVPGLMQMIKERKLEDRIRMLGYLSEEEIREVMGATDIILAPFLDMTGSASLNLGVSYRKAVIGSDIEQMKELKNRGMGVELFQSSNAEDLRRTINSLKQNPRRIEELEQLSGTYAADHSYDRTAARLSEIYATLATQ